jgi:hypothetical protein
VCSGGLAGRWTRVGGHLGCAPAGRVLPTRTLGSSPSSPALPPIRRRTTRTSAGRRRTVVPDLHRGRHPSAGTLSRAEGTPAPAVRQPRQLALTRRERGRDGGRRRHDRGRPGLPIDSGRRCARRRRGRNRSDLPSPVAWPTSDRARGLARWTCRRDPAAIYCRTRTVPTPKAAGRPQRRKHRSCVAVLPLRSWRCRSPDRSW